MFFSRTDERGVIRAFNDVFVRIADHPAETLLGAPHRIIRHPDMPRGVFHLMWEGIKAGHPVGAYVKNRARDGLHYWVFALVTPIEGGYLSVRIKPSCDLFPRIEDAYARLLAEEAAGLSPEASATRLCTLLSDLDFPSYAAFQTEAIMRELQSRRALMGLGPARDLDSLHRMVGELRVVRTELAALDRVLHGAGMLTANMRIVAAKLADGSRTISEIARSYGIMLTEVQDHVTGFEALRRDPGRFAACGEERGLFLLCAARLMNEVCADFRRCDAGFVGVDQQHEGNVLTEVAASYASQSRSAMDEVMDQARTLRRNVEFLRRLVVGLSTVRIACRVESGMLAQRSDGLDTIIGRIDGLQDTICTGLDRVDGACGTALSALRDWQGAGDQGSARAA